MNIKKSMISLVVVLLSLFAAMSVEAQRLSWETVVKSKFGSGTQLRTGPVTTRKADVKAEPVQENSLSLTDKKVIVGSWLETVTFPDPAPPLKSLVTFSEDGNMLVADQGAVTAEVVFSAGHGSWIHQRGRIFAWSQVEIIYDATDGSLVGYLKVNGVYTVDETGNGYTGEFHAAVAAPDGTILFSVDGTNSGNRIPVEVAP